MHISTESPSLHASSHRQSIYNDPNRLEQVEKIAKLEKATTPQARRRGASQCRVDSKHMKISGEARATSLNQSADACLRPGRHTAQRRRVPKLLTVEASSRKDMLAIQVTEACAPITILQQAEVPRCIYYSSGSLTVAHTSLYKANKAG